MSGDEKSFLHGEPAVDELLEDPIVELLLAFDRISLDSVQAEIAATRARLLETPGEDKAA